MSPRYEYLTYVCVCVRQKKSLWRKIFKRTGWKEDWGRNVSSLKDPTKSMKREEQDKKRSTKQGGGGSKRDTTEGEGGSGGQRKIKRGGSNRREIRAQNWENLHKTISQWKNSESSRSAPSRCDELLSPSSSFHCYRLSSSTIHHPVFILFFSSETRN